MSRANCTQCGKEYSWHARRGFRLTDFPSPCCHAPGKAVSHLKEQPLKRIYCPECHQAGLKRRDNNGYTGEHQTINGQTIWIGWITGSNWCPHCNKWVRAVTKGIE